MKEVRLSDLFATLSRGLPDWFLAAEGKSAAYRSASVEAMHRIVAFAEDPTKTTAHFRELLKTAAEQFNAGRCPRLQVSVAHRRREARRRRRRPRLGGALALDASKLMAQTQEAAQCRRFAACSAISISPHGLLSLDTNRIAPSAA
jgi:hypothetical protein